MILCTTLTDYNINLYIKFTITIEACIVYDIHVTHPPTLRIEYDVGEPTVMEPLPDTFLTPSDCGQLPTYTLFNQQTGLPVSWAYLDVQAMVFRIMTLDVRDAGTYYLVL